MIHQATCVAIGDQAILIEGEPGSGKSSLALALIDRGAALIGDDGVLLEVAAGVLTACPHPRTRGLIEVRNLGLIDVAARESAAVALIVVLDAAAPRYIEAIATAERYGVALPLIRLTPHEAILPIKVELALRAVVSRDD